MIYLKQSTASQEIPLGYFLDSTDGDTAETGLTIANTDIKLWKAGATTLANKNSGGGTHISGGIYYAVLDATDTNTLGPMVIFVHVSGALPVRLECCVLAANIYDSMIAGSDLLDVNTSQIEGADATDQINAACDTALSDYDAPTKAELDSGLAGLNDPTAAAIADAVLDEVLSGHTTAGTLGKAVADIEADTAQIGAAGDGLTAIPWNASWDAEVQSECADALTAYDPPTKAELDSGLAALNDLDAAGVATAVWNAATATYGSAGSYGLLVETNLDAQVSSASAPTAAAVADAVWDEAIAGHLGAGSTGEALNAAGDPWATTLPGAYGAGSAGYIIGNNLDAPISTVDTVVDGIQTDLSNGTDGLGAIKAAVDAIPTSNPTAAAIADAVLDEALSGHTTAGTFGKAVADIESDATAILADTNELQTDNIPGTLATLATAAALATVDSNVDAILVDTGTTIPAQINSVPTATENADALLNRDMSAVSDTNARTPLNALRFIRNKYSISGTTLTVTKEDDSTSAWTATLTTDAAAEPVTGSDPA